MKACSGWFFLITVGTNNGQSPSAVRPPSDDLPTVTSSICSITEPERIYSLESCTLLFYFYWRCPCVCSCAVFVHIAGVPMFTLSSGLNITATITRGIQTCQPISSASVNPTPGCKLRVAPTTLLSRALTFKWKLSPKIWVAGFRKKSLSLVCKEPWAPHHRWEGSEEAYSGPFSSM